MPELELLLPDPGTDYVSFGLWLVDVDEPLAAYDRVAEILIPGAVVDVTAGVAGRIKRRLVVPGDRLHAGQTLAILESDG